MLFPLLTFTYDHSINFAFQQNSIPVVKELHFKNDTAPRKDLVIKNKTKHGVALARSRTRRRLRAGQTTEQ